MPPPPPPATLAVADAIASNAGLADLLERLRESQDRLLAVAALLPDPLRAAVHAGALDTEGWTLLADDPSAAAKLRQMIPAIDAAARQAGFAPRPIRVKVARPAR